MKLEDQPAEENRREFNQAQPVFVSWLHALTAIRNVCAHHSRLWNRNLRQAGTARGVEGSGIANDRFYVIALIIQTLLADIAPDSAGANGSRLSSMPIRRLICEQCSFPSTGKLAHPGSNCYGQPLRTQIQILFFRTHL